jgi:hypothetical protein
MHEKQNIHSYVHRTKGYTFKGKGGVEMHEGNNKRRYDGTTGLE